MKVGDLVFVVSDRAGVEPGTRAQVVALNGSSAWVLPDSPPGGPVLPVQTWDLLPARTYGRVVLDAVRQTVRNLKAGSGSTSLLEPEQLVGKLVEHGLSVPAARRCVELWDAEQRGTIPLRVREWVQRIKRYYGQESISPREGR